MKIGILSFHNANNFGAVLQNYALQTWLKMNGHEVETIDYHCENLEKAYRNKPKIGKEMTKTEIWKSILVWCMNIYGLMRANRRFDAFRNQNINLSTATTRKDLEQLCRSYDIIICGSDQVWNESIVGNDYDVYSLAFYTNAYKASYAASVGSLPISETLLRNISQLDYITVRERSVSEFLGKEGIKNRIAIDPVFLLDSGNWEKTRKKTICEKKNYVLIYCVEGANLDKCITISERIKKNRRVIAINPIGLKMITSKIRCCNYAGPKEFLSYIYNADCIVTSSFHAVAFSLIFEKQFWVIPHKQTGQRVKDLLQDLRLENRILDLSDIDKIENEKRIDYNLVNKRIKKKISESEECLQQISIKGNMIDE